MAMGARKKKRRTYSLDPELVKYVERFRAECKISSASAALEEIIRESKKKRECQDQDNLIANYYSSLDDAEVEQEKEWGKFAETQFPMNKWQS